MIDIERTLELAQGAYPAWQRMKEDQKRVDCFRQDWEEATAKARETGDLKTLEALLKVWPALAMAFPTGLSTDPFKRFRLLADDFARALGFERYKARRNLK